MITPGDDLDALAWQLYRAVQRVLDDADAGDERPAWPDGACRQMFHDFVHKLVDREVEIIFMKRRVQ